MELLHASSATFSPLSSNLTISNFNRIPSFTFKGTLFQPRKSQSVGIVEARLQGFLLCKRRDICKRLGSCRNFVGAFKHEFLFRHLCKLNKSFSSQCGLISIKHTSSLLKVGNSSDRIRQHVSVLFVQLVFTVMLVTSTSFSVSETPSWALSEENRLFLEAWRTIDRAYVDKTFNGQSWFQYRENALQNEPMNTREETYVAIRKMLATLDDPFARFLEPEKFNSLQSGTQGAVTGVGLSIGYPTAYDGSSAGLVVISRPETSLN